MIIIYQIYYRKKKNKRWFIIQNLKPYTTKPEAIKGIKRLNTKIYDFKVKKI